ncbi:hypothetical protein [Hymenobacter cavernae]|uniref:Outer membrane protein beta-barrel domain-containing protein n=1 Tax=Hymenobacter cavernae TaxID=2044852 RepID=A0ABQ1U072_9BACT|nr:hypothetical protein [Hymenobacter cavernae]GGF05391.1 hypothetical protein GCM10011383_15660 [Hymenobacter cavernae]
MMFQFASFRFVVQVTLVGGLSLGSHVATAQKYITAAGLRLGKENFGITVQQRIRPKGTLEGIGIIRNREVSATLLAEHHFGLLGRSLNYYAGGGGHLGTQKNHGGFGGIDGILGLEYKVAFFPIVLALDVKPSVEISNHEDWFRVPTAFSLRYVFIKEKNTGLFDRVFGDDDNKKKNKRKEKEKNSTRRGLFDF